MNIIRVVSSFVLLITMAFSGYCQSIDNLEKSYGFKDILFCMHEIGIKYKLNGCDSINDNIKTCAFKHSSYKTYGGIKLDEVSVIVSNQLVRAFALEIIDPATDGVDGRAEKMLKVLSALYGKPSSVDKEKIHWKGDQVGIYYYPNQKPEKKDKIYSTVYFYHTSYSKYFDTMPKM